MTQGRGGHCGLVSPVGGLGRGRDMSPRIGPHGPCEGEAESETAQGWPDFGGSRTFHRKALPGSHRDKGRELVLTVLRGCCGDGAVGRGRGQLPPWGVRRRGPHRGSSAQQAQGSPSCSWHGQAALV